MKKVKISFPQSALINSSLKRCKYNIESKFYRLIYTSLKPFCRNLQQVFYNEQREQNKCNRVNGKLL